MAGGSTDEWRGFAEYRKTGGTASPGMWYDAGDLGGKDGGIHADGVQLGAGTHGCAH